MTSTHTSPVTLADIEAVYDVTHLEHLDRQASVPVVSRLAFQGDVAIIRTYGAQAGDAIPSAGFPVVRGENGGNTHALFGPGFYTPARPRDGELKLGTLTVPAGEQVLLSHPEHGGMIIVAGTYELRRQREQADEIRLVQD